MSYSEEKSFLSNNNLMGLNEENEDESFDGIKNLSFQVKAQDNNISYNIDFQNNNVLTDINKSFPNERNNEQCNNFNYFKNSNILSIPLNQSYYFNNLSSLLQEELISKPN